MATAKEVIKIAAAEIGVKESPANSNKVKYWDFYKKRTGLNLQGNPWCAAFVSYVMATAGVWEFKKDAGMYRYCPSLVNYAKEKGQWLGRTKNPEPGDIVLFKNSSGVACHVGIVEKKISDTCVQTIEGNTSASSGGSQSNGGIVARRKRDYNGSMAILGFMRPAYKTTTATKTTTTTTTKTTTTAKTTTTTTTAAKKQVKVTAKSGLNLRKSASTTATVLKCIPYGTKLTVEKTSGNWCKVTYGGKTGWCYKTYLA